MIKKLLLAAFLVLSATISSAQISLVSDYTTLMNIPDVVAIEASATHMYVLSDSEGLVVFRTNVDTLQYIFTSDGMTTRGNRMQSDVRFAYLYGNGTRLSVLEPTSLLGVYSSTFLPVEPRSVARVGNYLYAALGNAGLAKLSLATPALFDSDFELVELPVDDEVSYIARLPLQLLVLLGNDQLAFFDIEGNDIRHNTTITLNQSVSALHVLDGTLYASNVRGDVFQVRSSGLLHRTISVNAPISKIALWNEYFIMHTNNNLLFAGKSGDNPVRLRSNSDSGNTFGIANNRLWLTSYSELAQNNFKQEEASRNTARSQNFSINSIPNIVVPFPRPVLLPLTVSNDSGDIRFHYNSEADNAEIRGNAFYWQPQNNQIGNTQFTIIATNSVGQVDSTSFLIDVRAFNAPPRFNPMRPISIAVGENYSLPIRAIDPDGLDTELIRYHGVNLPDGASISERTGMLTWTPDRRQVGVHEFQVIATDQYGAAASITINLSVRNISREE